MGIFLADRSFFVVVIKEAGQMVSGFTFFSETFFADAVSAFPAGRFGAVIGMRAAMGYIVGLAFACKEMFCVCTPIF